jgi:hypothetical protein
MTTRTSTACQLTSRDIGVLLDLFECRVMTQRHMTSLHFSGHGEAAKRRIRRLKIAGYLRHRPRRVTEPAVYFLTHKAFNILRKLEKLAAYPKLSWPVFEKRIYVSPLTLQHELGVITIKAAILADAKRAGAEIGEFSTWPAMHQFRIGLLPNRAFSAKDSVVKPDAYLRLKPRNDSTSRQDIFFIELDRSTESQPLLVAKSNLYSDYYRSGGYAHMLGQSRASFKKHPFRVLWIFRNIERRDNFAAALFHSRPAALSQAWLTTFDEVIRNPFGPIWIRPKDYLEAINSAPKSVADGNAPFSPGTQSIRPWRVDDVVSKHRLMSAA